MMMQQMDKKQKCRSITNLNEAIQDGVKQEKSRS